MVTEMLEILDMVLGGGPLGTLIMGALGIFGAFMGFKAMTAKVEIKKAEREKEKATTELKKAEAKAAAVEQVNKQLEQAVVEVKEEIKLKDKTHEILTDNVNVDDAVSRLRKRAKRKNNNGDKK